MKTRFGNALLSSNKTITVMNFIVTAALSLAGCKKKSADNAAPGGAPKSGQKLTVGFAQAGAESDWRVAESKSIKDEAAKRGKEVTAVYAHNDNMALGAIEAIKAAGKKPGVDILVVSIDAVKAAFTAMVVGELNCTVECNPLLGPLAFDAVEKARKGEALPKKTVVPDQVFEQSVTATELANRKY